MKKRNIKTEYDLFNVISSKHIITRYFCLACKSDPLVCGHKGTPVEGYDETIYKCNLCGIEIKIGRPSFGGDEVKDHFYRHLDKSQRI